MCIIVFQPILYFVYIIAFILSMNIFTFYNWRKRTNAQSNREI